jgi:hypothetical protein
VQKYYVRCPAEANIAKHITRVRVNCEEYAGIAGAQQAARNGIEIQSMRPRRRNVVLPRYFGGITSINNNDARWGSDVDEKQLVRFVVNCPARTTGHLDFRNALSACEVYNRHRVRIRDQGIANVRREQEDEPVNDVASAIRLDDLTESIRRSPRRSRSLSITLSARSSAGSRSTALTAAIRTALYGSSSRGRSLSITLPARSPAGSRSRALTAAARTSMIGSPSKGRSADAFTCGDFHRAQRTDELAGVRRAQCCTGCDLDRPISGAR